MGETDEDVCALATEQPIFIGSGHAKHVREVRQMSAGKAY